MKRKHQTDLERCFAARLAESLDLAGLARSGRAAYLAEHLNITPQAARNLFKGQNLPSLQNLVRLSVLLRVGIDRLLGLDHALGEDLPADLSTPAGRYVVPSATVPDAVRAAFADSGMPLSRDALFALHAVTALGLDPAHLALTRAVNDHMHPTIAAGDWVLLDMRLTHLRDGCYAVHAGHVDLRRLTMDLDGSIALSCDNAHCDVRRLVMRATEEPTILAVRQGARATRITVLGRVVLHMQSRL